MKTTTTPKKTASVKAAAKRRKEIVAPIDDSNDMDEEMVVTKTSTKSGSGFGKVVFMVIAVLLLIGMGVYKFKYVFIPATVNGKPIFVTQYLSYLHTTYGKDALQAMTTQDLIQQAIVKANVKVSDADVQKEVDSIDKQASASGGINAVLATQQMTMAQFKDQIRIQLAVKLILKDKIAVSDAEVMDSFTKNKDVFKTTPQADALAQIRSQLENQKFQQSASAWLSDLRKNSTVTINIPGMQ